MIKIKSWDEFLDTFGYCHMHKITGNRPCDNGSYCDKCHAPEVQKEFDNWKKEESK